MQSVMKWSVGLAALGTLGGLVACEGDLGRPVYPTYDKTILQLAKEDADLSTFVELVTLAGLNEALDKTATTFTVFAPTNAAFSGVAGLEALKEDPAAVSALLRFHMLAGHLGAATLALGGDFRTITSTTVHIESSGGATTVTDYLGTVARVTKADLFAKNGVIHVVDKVLAPPPVCGDGIMAETEACDDGNSEDGDGCSAACLVELSLYERLGGSEGISTVINGFVGRVAGDAKINGYFLNSSVSSRLGGCLTKQVGALTGGPEVYPAAGEPADADGCRNMKDAHLGMGISMDDFGDLAGHLVDELAARGVAQADIDTIVGVLGPMAADIVENPMNNETIYLRAGRKPGVTTVVNDFAGRVLGDVSINGFFTGTNANRLGTCLVRQVCGATGGPCKYGEEVGPELFDMTPCRSMAASHATLTNPVGGAGAPITKMDFDVLVGHLVGALDDAGVVTADRDAIVGVLGPLCPDIVTSTVAGTTCND